MSTSAPTLRRWVARLGITLLVATLLGGGLYYAWREIRGAEEAAASELAAAGTLKARQISEWYRERVDDATGRAQDPLFVASLRAWRQGDRSPSLTSQLQGSITPKREPWRYLNTWILDPEGRPQLSARNRSLEVAGTVSLRDCLRAVNPLFGAVEALGTPQPYMDLCAAIVVPGGEPAGIYLLRIDTTQLLLPIVQFWPRESASGVTALVHPRGEQFAILLSSRASGAGAVPPSQLPDGWLTAPDGPLGSGHLVADIRTVAGTPWRLVLSVARAEVRGDAIDELTLVGLLTATLLLTGGLAFQLLGQRRQRAHTAQIIRMDRLLRVRNATNEAIVHLADRDAILSRFCEIAVTLGRFEFAAVFELSPDSRALRLEAWSGPLPKRLRGDVAIPFADTGGTDLLAPVVDRGEVVILPDLAKEPPLPWIRSLQADGHRAVVAIPIREAGRVAGIASLYSSEAGAFDRLDTQLFDELAGDLEFALERVAAELHRRVVEAQLLAVSDAAPFAIFLVTVEGSRIERVNRAAIRQYGYTEQQLVGEPATMIFDREHLTPPPASGEHAPLPMTATHQTRDGRALTVEVVTRPIVVDGRAAVVVVAVDVTERRQLEEQYRQAQRLEAVGQMAGGIAHDFNNLLTVIGGFASFVLEDLPSDAPARPAAERIQRAASRATELTRRILAFSRRQTLDSRPVSLNGIVRETATMLERVLGEDVLLDLKLDATRDIVNVDASQMHQVVMNLAMNARDAMRRGGRLTVATADGANDVELRVTDTGAGISPAVVEHIFEPFFTTKPSGEGTGLGLATVHGIVMQSGGTISVHTEVGVGTSFEIRLPRSAADDTAPAETAHETPPAGQGTVMLVEDDPAVRALIALVLVRGGYTVIEFGNGAEALAHATAGARQRLDLLVSDIVMPAMSGPELAARLRSFYPGLAVLFVSGYAEDAAARLDLDLRTIDLLRKPFTPQELLSRVTTARARTRH